MAGPTGDPLDARAVETTVPKLSSGLTEVGAGLGPMVPTVPCACASGEVKSTAGLCRRCCTGQVAYVARHMSVNNRHRVRRRVQGGVY